MEDRLLQLFPDQVVQLKEYTSFVNQPERIQVTSQEDMNDYDPNTLTSYYNFRVRLPRPALNVKTLQLARASIPNAIPNIQDTELVFWYYALPTVSAGTSFATATGQIRDYATGDAEFVFDAFGVLYNLDGTLADGAVYYDSGTITIGATNYTYDKDAASPGNVWVDVLNLNVPEYQINYTSPERAPIQPSFLRYIRLVPSNAQPELMDNFTGGYNRTFQDYDDLVTELNNATEDDLLNGEPSNEVSGTFKFIEDQVSFSYNQRFNKIVFTGLDQTFSYIPAPSDDPNWAEAAIQLQQRDRDNTRFVFSGAIKTIQPFQPYRDLNLRLGFTYATFGQGDNFLNMLRPIPPYIVGSPNLGAFTEYDHVAPGYADLVYSACCHLYTDITGGSTVDSLLNKALLGSVPMNTPNLGVGFHSLPLNNPLTKIATQLNEIYIEMRTDTGAPFYLGNNVIVSLELILTY